MAIITLTTDFGDRDSYVGQMKGVIFSAAPNAQVIDIAHGIPKYDLRAAASVLTRAMPEFPEGTIHIVVVDPGVGSLRRRLIASVELPVRGDSTAKRSMYFVGPDNGLLSALMTSGCKQSVHEIANASLVPGIEQRFTFDGRDVFAPAAVLLANGTALSGFGPEFNDLAEIPALECQKTETGIKGAVVGIDSFGNFITNIPNSMLGARIERTQVIVQGRPLPIVASYSELNAGSAGVLVNSAGVLEIAVNQGSAELVLGLSVGEQVFIIFN